MGAKFCHNSIKSQHSSLKYSGDYPNLLFEKPWESPTLIVNQNNFEITKGEKILFSEGFSKCWALLIKEKSGSYRLFHIQQRLNWEAFEYLTSSQDIEQAILISGSQSVVQDLDKLSNGTFSMDWIQLNSGSQHWSLAFDPKSRNLYLNSKSLKTLVELKVFN